MTRLSALGLCENVHNLESIRLLRDMLTQPERIERNVRRYSAGVMFSLLYGKWLHDDDKELKVVKELVDDFIHDCYPGTHLVDTFPALDSLPDLLAPWRAEARRKHEKEIEVGFEEGMGVAQQLCDEFYADATK